MNQRSKIAIVGFGVEGKAMMAYLVEHQYNDITVCDKNLNIKKAMPDGVSVRLGADYLEGLSDFDVIFRSPGVNYNEPAIVGARLGGAVVTSPTQYFLDHCPCTVIGVTGTKGKGTTSTLIYEILKAGVGEKGCKTGAVWLGGNIGNPPIEFLDKVRGSDVVVLELSCFQLGDLNKSPAVAVLLNTTSDHLDYYPDRDEYLQAKELILTHQDSDDLAILNKDYEYARYYAPLVKGKVKYVSPRGNPAVGMGGVYVDEGWIKGIFKGERVRVMRVSDVALIGSHNLENVCPAILVGEEFGVSAKVIAKVVRGFKGLPHRLEFVRKLQGVSYYNDSFSTNPQTSMAAVDSFSFPTVLIAGGSDKELNYLEWARKILTKASLEAVVLIGATSGKMEEAIKRAKVLLKEGEATPTEIIRCKDLREAVGVATDRAVKFAGRKRGFLGVGRGQAVVVMSPAAASFDQFKNYKERGERFREEVGKI